MNTDNMDDILQERFLLLQLMSNDDLCSLVERTTFPPSELLSQSMKPNIYGKETILERIIADIAQGSINLETDKPRTR